MALGALLSNGPQEMTADGSLVTCITAYFPMKITSVRFLQSSGASRIRCGRDTHQDAEATRDPARRRHSVLTRELDLCPEPVAA
jgi:hypothetical protein